MIDYSKLNVFFIIAFITFLKLISPGLVVKHVL